MLLDPHHQPSNDEYKPVSPNALRPKSFASNLDSQTHRTEGRSHPVSSNTNPALPAQAQGLVGHEDKLDHSAGGEFGSWNYGDQVDDQSESEEDVDALTGDAGGVLGLIRQFQKAQNDDKRAGPSV